MSKKKNLFGQKRRPLSVYQLCFALIIGLGIIGVSLLQATPAHAHALLVKSDPAALAVLQSPPDRVTLVFSEKLNTKLSNIRVLDRNATRIDLGDSFVEPNDPYQMSVGVNPIVGVYAVLWTSASAEDGHTLKGSFTFSVAAPTPTAAPSSSTAAPQTTQTQGLSSGTNPPGTSAPTINPSGTSSPGVRPTPTPVPSEPGIVAPPTELPGSTSPDDMSGMDMSEGLSTTNIVLLLLTWLMQVGLVAWLGGAFFLSMIIGPGLRANGADWLWSARRTATARLVVLTRIGVVFIVVGIVGRLFEEALSISNGDWTQALSNTTIDGVINGSSYGFLSVTTIEAAVVGFCLSLAVPLYRLRPRTPDAQSVARSEKAWRRTLAIMRGELLVAAIGTLTLAGSGHAAAVADITNLAIGIDWLHLAASAIWLAGIIGAPLALLPALQSVKGTVTDESVIRRNIYIATLDRYSPYAYAAILVLILSGVANTVFHIGTPENLVTTPYGLILITKHALIAVMACISFYTVFRLRPALKRQNGDALLASVVERRLLTWLRVSPGLSLLVLLAAAGLTVFPVMTMDMSSPQNQIQPDNVLAPVTTAVPTVSLAPTQVLVQTPTVAAQITPGLTAPAAPTTAPAPTATAVPSIVSAIQKVDNLTLTFSASPGTIGANTFTLLIIGADGKPVTDALAQLKTTMLAMDMGTTTLEMVPVPNQPGLLHIEGSLAMAGAWQAEITVRRRSVSTTVSATFRMNAHP